MTLEDKIIGAIKGSLVNLVTQEIPNFRRSSSIWMEQWTGDSIGLYAIEANKPAIALEDGSIYLEPEGVNQVNYNLDLGNPVWIKGSNCFVLLDKAAMAGTTGNEAYLGDRISFASGEGQSQILKRSLSLQAGTDYYLSILLRLSGGTAGTNDVLRIANQSISLSKLNAYPNRVRLLELAFKTSGTQPKLPDISHDSQQNIVSTVSTNTVTVTLTGTVDSGQLVGGIIRFTGDKSYKILSNTASGSNTVSTITVDASSLIVDGVTVGVPAYLEPPSAQVLDLEFYVESTLTLDFLGIQIEKRNFRTSFIFQDSDLQSRSASKLVFRRTPLAELKTFGVFFAVKTWRGDGLIFDAGNLSAKISQGFLVVQADTAIIQSQNKLNNSFNFFIQVSEENNNISLYVDKVLVARIGLINFIINKNAQLKLTSEGVRSYYHAIFTDKLLRDGQVDIGKIASQDILELFDSPGSITAKTISTNLPLIILPSVVVPSKPQPLIKSRILDIDLINGTVTIQDSNFPANTSCTVVRDNIPILRPRSKSINGVVVQLDVVSGIIRGDYLVYGNVDQPGQASVRLPFISVEGLPILAIDPAAKTLRVASTLSYSIGRLFIHSQQYQEINEIKIINKDDASQLLYVNDLADIQQGHIAVQPANYEDAEMLIHPDNYEALFLNPVSGLDVSWKYSNGMVITNKLDIPVEIQPCIRVNY